jgi:hypothetical protein
VRIVPTAFRPGQMPETPTRAGRVIYCRAGMSRPRLQTAAQKLHGALSTELPREVELPPIIDSIEAKACLPRSICSILVEFSGGVSNEKSRILRRA